MVKRISYRWPVFIFVAFCAARGASEALAGNRARGRQPRGWLERASNSMAIRRSGRLFLRNFRTVKRQVGAHGRQRRPGPRGGQRLDLQSDTRYISRMIRSFADKRTAAVFANRMPEGFPSDVAKVARRKLRMVDQARALDDLRRPPGNKLHPLKDDRSGQHAIWVNDQFRVCFVWRDGDAYDVEITDYHDD